MHVPRNHADVLIIGAGLGGVAAARAALAVGRTLTRTDAADWTGGQMTTQAVPPDDHAWTESDLASRSYRELRERIREHYRAHYPPTDQARVEAHHNPADGFVSAICHEPR